MWLCICIYGSAYIWQCQAASIWWVLTVYLCRSVGGAVVADKAICVRKAALSCAFVARQPTNADVEIGELPARRPTEHAEPVYSGLRKQPGRTPHAQMHTNDYSCPSQFRLTSCVPKQGQSLSCGGAAACAACSNLELLCLLWFMLFLYSGHTSISDGCQRSDSD